MSVADPTLNSFEYPPDPAPFAHFMLKEIHEQPAVLRSCLQAYFSSDAAVGVVNPALRLPSHLLENLTEVHILACGTSRHAGLVAQTWLEQLVGIPTRVRSAAGFCATPFPLSSTTLTIAASQSGETADTLAALQCDSDRRSQQEKIFHPRRLAITNQPTSSLATQVDAVLPTLAGVEMGVAATKTFLAQLVVVFGLVLELAQRQPSVSLDRLSHLSHELPTLPDRLSDLLLQTNTVQTIARRLVTAQHCLVLGQGINWPIALEGALKLKETTYLHAEGAAIGEFMHGPLAMLDASVPVVAIVPMQSDPAMLTYLRKIRATGAPLIGLCAQPELAEIFDWAIELPSVDEWLSPFLTVVPLQLLAYYLAVERGIDVDRPRHITKAIT